MAESVQKKPGFGARVKRFFTDIKGEFKKIIWPDKAQVINNTIIVVGVVILAAVVLGLIDLGASQLLKLFINLITK